MAKIYLTNITWAKNNTGFGKGDDDRKLTQLENNLLYAFAGFVIGFVFLKLYYLIII